MVLIFFHAAETGAFTSGNYGAPPGYCFDASCHYCRDDPIIDTEVRFFKFIQCCIFLFSHTQQLCALPYIWHSTWRTTMWTAW